MKRRPNSRPSICTARVVSTTNLEELTTFVAITAWPSSTALAQTAPAESASAAAPAASATAELATRVDDLGIGRERSLMEMEHEAN
jgi:hypothetical protein